MALFTAELAHRARSPTCTFTFTNILYTHTCTLHLLTFYIHTYVQLLTFYIHMHVH